MLTLTRRPHEEIVVIDTETGERIIVAAARCHGSQMKIGIEASKRFQILRRELIEEAGAGRYNWISASVCLKATPMRCLSSKAFTRMDRAWGRGRRTSELRRDPRAAAKSR